MKSIFLYFLFAQLLYCQHPANPDNTNGWLAAQERIARNSTGGSETTASHRQRAYWRVTLSNGVEFDSADVRSLSGDSVLIIERETLYWIPLRSVNEVRILKPSNAFLCAQAGATTGFVTGLIAVGERTWHPLESTGFYFAGPGLGLLCSVVGGLFGAAVGVLGDGDIVCHLEERNIPERRSALLDAIHSAENSSIRDVHVSLMWGYSLSRFDKGGISDESVPKTFAASSALCLNGEVSMRVYGPLALWIGGEKDMTPLLEELTSVDTEFFKLQKGNGKFLRYIPAAEIYAGTLADVVRAGARLPFVDNDEMRIALGIGGGLFNYRSGFYLDDAMQSPISETEGTAYGLCADATFETKLTNGSSFISRIEISSAPKTLVFSSLFVQNYEWTNRINLGGLRFLLGISF